MIHQQKYVKELLKRFGMKQAKSLLYLTASRPDIVYSVGLSVRFQSNSKETHLKAVKWILRHLKHISDLALWYSQGCNFDIIGYADDDYGGFLVDRKSTSGVAHFLGPCLVSWATKKQHSIAMSTVEAEYVASTSYCAQLLWATTTTKGLFC